jgi:hypothetical protein
MTSTWTVYTVTEHPGGGWAVAATKWSEDGPGEARVMARRGESMTREQAEFEARFLQRSYDRVRGKLPVPAEGEKL